MNIATKWIIIIILSIIPALYIFCFDRIAKPDSRLIDNIRTFRFIFITNMILISYIVFHELPVYI